MKSLRSSEAFRQFVMDQLEPLDVSARSMFGGVGLYSAGVFFGIVAFDTLYLKVDESNKANFEREGMPAFQPFANGRVSTKYYAVPVSVLESAPELVRWARESLQVAGRDATARGSPTGAKRTTALDKAAKKRTASRTSLGVRKKR